MVNNMLSIGEVAKRLGVSIDTLRRWDESGKLPAVKNNDGGHRYYHEADIQFFNYDFFKTARQWVSNQSAINLSEDLFSSNSAAFQLNLMRFEKRLGEMAEFKMLYPLIVSICGEIGNNSFDHNLGNWPDVAGVFFGYDLVRGYAVLADRGQGILKTLQKIKPDLNNDEDALRVAFSEIISGRFPESRGNGLKFVMRVVASNNFSLFFQTGDAELHSQKSDQPFRVEKGHYKIHGCLALIKFANI